MNGPETGNVPALCNPKPGAVRLQAYTNLQTYILGGIFKRLIDPKERHKFGQHYTNEDLRDVVNAFCICKAGDKVLDPRLQLSQFYRPRLLAQIHAHN
jgi:hypothetical protein